MKGFVGGIPIALLAVAAQAKFAEHQEHDFHPHAGGTVIGGPSGDDSDGGFTSPYSANIKTNTQVHEYSKDDHSVHLKHKDVYPPPHFHFGPPVVEKGPQVPGMGPFEKRGAPGGTVIGGPSGNDEGQSFDMPITGVFQTEVNDYNKDDHSIAVKNKDVHPPPQFHGPPPQFHPPHGYHGRPAGPPSAAFNAPPSTFEKRWGPEEEHGTVMGGPGGGSHHGPAGFHHPHGGTVIGGPSGDDEGISFSKPVTGHFKTNVNEYSKDDHSIDLKHKDVYPPPHFPPWGAPFKRGWGREHEKGATVMGGPSGNDGGQSVSAPVTVDTDTDVNEHSEDDHSIHLKHKDVYPPPHFPPWGAPFKRGWGREHEKGATVMGGPSGNDGGQSFSAPVTVDTDTDVNEHSEDDHSIHLKHKDVYPPPHFPAWGAHPPFRRAYSPSREAGGGTVIGGPSGDDDGTDYSDPTNIDVTSGVNEHHEDDHAIKGDFTHVHPPATPHYSWADDEEGPYSYEEGPYSYEASPGPVEFPVPESSPAPPSDSPQGAPAPPAAGSPPAYAEVPQAANEAEAPHREDHQECAAKVHEVVRTVTKTQYKTVDATPEVPKLYKAQTSAVSMAATPQMSAQVDPKVFSNAVPLSGSASSGVRSYAPYSYASQRLMSHAASYSTVPVHVPMATPASSSYSRATPSGSMAKMMPTGVDPMSHGAKSSAAASPSEHATMFEGGAARLSGGLLSAAAGVMGVLAFIL
ncbi:hypothetical protein N7499_006487 [Penicillium canescens]|nr:hypothetical protein N7499_006487 [Penicillium canescens]KAJ6176587.1 hypothetical protein N7485_003501 [Penicillium canescens]